MIFSFLIENTILHRKKFKRKMENKMNSRTKRVSMIYYFNKIFILLIFDNKNILNFHLQMFFYHFVPKPRFQH